MKHLAFSIALLVGGVASAQSYQAQVYHLLPQSTAPSPPSGHVALFNDSTNSNHPSWIFSGTKYDALYTLGGLSVSTTVPQPGQGLIYNGSIWSPSALANTPPLYTATTTDGTTPVTLATYTMGNSATLDVNLRALGTITSPSQTDGGLGEASIHAYFTSNGSGVITNVSSDTQGDAVSPSWAALATAPLISYSISGSSVHIRVQGTASTTIKWQSLDTLTTPAVAGANAGPVGPAGPAGAAVNWRGTWSSGATYQLIDAVSYANPLSGILSSFISLGQNSNQAPLNGSGVLNATYWAYLAQGEGPNWRGTWSNATAYSVNDAVQFADPRIPNGPISSYLCTVGNTNNAPLNSSGALSADWSIVANGPTIIVSRTTDSTIEQYGLVKFSTTAGHVTAFTTTDAVYALAGVALTSGSATQSVSVLAPRNVETNVVSDGTTTINPGDPIQPSTTVNDRVMKGTAGVICNATAAAAATAGTVFTCQ